MRIGGGGGGSREAILQNYFYNLSYRDLCKTASRLPPLPPQTAPLWRSEGILCSICLRAPADLC
jgi:hypothetical protein